MSSTRHKYEYDAKPNTAAAKVAEMVGVGKRVLELGSGPGSITRVLKGNKCQVTALEVDAAAIEAVSHFAEQVLCRDLNSASWSDGLADDGLFDVVVAGDVLEHLYDPWVTLRRINPLLSVGGFMVVSLPHVGHSAVIACLMGSDFDYQPWGLLDKTHIRFFGIMNMQKLFDEAGLKIVAADFIVRTPEQTEFAAHWNRLPLVVRQAISGGKFGLIYQVVVKAVPLSACGEALDLASLAVPAASKDTFFVWLSRSRLGRMVIQVFGYRLSKMVANFLARSGFKT